MSNISQWSTSAASNNAAPPDGFPEGQAPSTVNDCARELMAAIARQYSDSDGSLVTGGASNAYTLTTNNGHAALADQGLIVFRADRANTGAATLEVDSLGAKNIQADGNALEADDLVADSLYLVAYNATNDTYDLLNSLVNKLVVGTDVQAWDTDLDDIAALSNADGNFIVGDGANWTVESDATARASLQVPLDDLSDADISGLTGIDANDLDTADDGFLVDDNGVTKRMSYQQTGFKVVDVAGATETIAAGDLNTVRRYTNAGGCAVTINTGTGSVGKWLVLIQGAAGQVTTAGTSTINGALGTDTSGDQNSGITLLCVATDVWTVLGNAG